MNGGLHFQQSISRACKISKNNRSKVAYFFRGWIGLGASFYETCDMSILIKYQFQDLEFLFEFCANGIQVNKGLG